MRKKFFCISTHKTRSYFFDCHAHLQRKNLTNGRAAETWFEWRTHYIISPPVCERHAMTDKVRIGVKRDICWGVVRVCIPVISRHQVWILCMLCRVRAYIASVPSPVKDVGKRTSGIKRCNKYTLQFDIQSQATHSLNSRIKQLTMDFEICDFGWHL